MRDKPLAPAYTRYAEVYDLTGGDEFSLSMLPRLSVILRGLRWTPKSALDLACGTGSFAINLAREGMTVIGLDLSESMLERARQKGQAVPALPVSFRQGDMRDFRLPQPVDLVTCFFDAMNYNLCDTDLLATFRCVSRALTPQGVFVFDMNSVHSLSRIWGNDVFAEDFGDAAYIWDSVYDPASRCGKLTATFFVKKGELYERFTELHVERAYPIAVVKRYLAEAGLHVVEVGKPDGRPAREQDIRHVYVARKINPS